MTWVCLNYDQMCLFNSLFTGTKICDLLYLDTIIGVFFLVFFVCVCVCTYVLIIWLLGLRPLREEVWVPDALTVWSWSCGPWDVDEALRFLARFLGAQLHSSQHHGYIICPFCLILLILDWTSTYENQYSDFHCRKAYCLEQEKFLSLCFRRCMNQI